MTHAAMDKERHLAELVASHRALYAHAAVMKKLQRIVHPSPSSALTKPVLQTLFHRSASIFFDTHVEMVSGHHTADFFRFEALARHPALIAVIVRDMAQWILGLSKNMRIDGVLAPASDARLLVQGIVEHLGDRLPLRVILAPFDGHTGKIGTDVPSEVIRPGERYLVLNDVTTRGNCVAKLGRIVTDHGGQIAGMMVFVRRDSGQFPFMHTLTTRYPFYYGVELSMPQWEQPACTRCQRGDPLFSWQELPTIPPPEQRPAFST